MDAKTISLNLGAKRSAVAEIRRQAGSDFDLMKTTLVGETVDLRSTALSAMMDEVDALQTQLQGQEAIETALRANDEAIKNTTEVRNALPNATVSATESRKLTVPATARRNGTLKCFRGADAEAKAYGFGSLFMAGLYGSEYAIRYCNEHGIPLQVERNERIMDIRSIGSESVNNLGGLLVPNIFMADIIDNRELYGIARQNIKVVSMPGALINYPYRKAGLSGAWAGDGDVAIFDKKKWGNVELIAKKYMVGGLISNELSEDALINVGDDLAQEITYQFGFNEDNSIFMGDGSSTYGGITGLFPAIGSVAGNKGIVVAGQIGGADYHSLIINDFENMEGACPVYALGNAKWYVSQPFYTQSMKRIQNAAGGNTNITLTNGVPAKTFMGYPVVVSQVLPSVAGVNQICCAFGDLTRAGILGDRNMISIKTATEGAGAFESDSLAILGTQRIGATIHSPGTSAVAGPVVVLKTSAT
jgi:HK97 family phage major capsid protein